MSCERNSASRPSACTSSRAGRSRSARSNAESRNPSRLDRNFHNMSAIASIPLLTPDDLASDQDVRWCPGCGDFSILAILKKVLAGLGIPRERFVFVSGIGCASRMPYYLNVFGLQGIHGRAPAIATGLKLANPDLHVWVVTGDGDALSA